MLRIKESMISKVTGKNFEMRKLKKFLEEIKLFDDILEYHEGNEDERKLQ